MVLVSMPELHINYHDVCLCYTDYVAKFAFEGNNVNDLSFWPGDVIKVLWAEDTGWWHGQLGNKLGWFPGSYVEVIDKYCTPVCYIDKVVNLMNRSSMYIIFYQLTFVDYTATGRCVWYNGY